MKNNTLKRKNLKHAIADKFVKSIGHSVNFERNYKNVWHEAESMGDYKSIGFLHYGYDKYCSVQAWHDKITKKRRWWFGLSFSSQSRLNDFLSATGEEAKIKFNYSNSKLDDSSLMKLVEEKWTDESEYYLGVYSIEDSEPQAMKELLRIVQRLPDNNYIEINRRFVKRETKAEEICLFKSWDIKVTSKS